MIKHLACLLLALCAAHESIASESIIQKEESVISGRPFGGFFNPKPHPLGSQKIVNVQGMPFSRAIRTQGKRIAQNRWDFQLEAKTVTNVKEGDVLLASFWLRCVQSKKSNGSCQTTFVFQQNGEPWTDVVNRGFSVGPEWQRFDVPFKSNADFPKGGAKIAFRLGYDFQTLDFAELKLGNFGRDKVLSDLPRTRITYDGRQPDASWRARAHDRISEHRMAGLTVKVLDAHGQPVEGAQVEIEQKRSAFKWGAAVQERLLNDEIATPGSTAETYQRIIKQWFNTATAENALKAPALYGDWSTKWGDESDQWGFEVAERATKWIHDNGFFQRGHAMVWPGWGNLPKDWRQLSNRPRDLERKLLNHIEMMGVKMSGRIQHWDVLNEPYTNSDVTKILGDRSLISWFRAAKAADPKAVLFLNDFLILEGGGGDTNQRRSYERTIQYLLSNGAPLEGLGMQGHFAEGLTGMDDLQAILDRFSRFNLPIFVTEYDIAIDDLELAADFTRDFLTLMYSNPQVGGVINWEFWDGHHENGSGTYFYTDWSLKPAGQVWLDLVLGDWKTRKKSLSNAEGVVQIRGHLGDYEVVAGLGGKRAVGNVNLNKPGRELVLILH